jgi:hypothetical protein
MVLLNVMHIMYDIKILSLCSLLYVRDQVLHPYKMAGKIVVMLPVSIS